MKRLFYAVLISLLLLPGVLSAFPYVNGGGGGGGGGAVDLTAPGPIGGTTPAAGDFTTLQANTSLGVGTTTAGANANIVATLGTELITAPMVTAGWTLGADTGAWTITAGVLTKTASTGTLTATAVSGMTSAPTAGVTYKVTIVCSAVSGAPTYTLGGVPGTTITATTITDYITASTTAKIIFSGGAAVTTTITSVSVQALTDATGDLTVDGNIRARSPILMNDGTILSPAYSFYNDPDTGIYRYSTGGIGFVGDGVRLGQWNSAGIGTNAATQVLNFYGDVILGRDAANTLTQKNAATQQVLRIYNTADTAWGTLTNYERLALTGVQGASVNLTAETAGTGGDNLDVILTPAGTGTVKAGAYTVLNTNTGAPASGIALTALANQAAYTLLANGTSGAAAPTAIAPVASSVWGCTAAGVCGYQTTIPLSALDLTSATSSIPWPVGTGTPGTTAGRAAVETDDTGSSSGGTLKWFDGAQVRSVVDTGTNYTIITKTEYLPIRYAEDGTTAPSAIAEVGTSTAVARSFTEADDVVFWWVVPNDYVGGVKYRVIYALSANAQANETVIFSMAGSVIANSGALAGAAGTALTITQELTTDEDTSEAMITAYSAESNADWSLAAGALARLEFSNAAAGDYTGEPLVIGVEIKYKAKIIGFGGY